MVMARAGSGTATTAAWAPARPARAGSSRSRGGSERSVTTPSRLKGVEAVHGRVGPLGDDGLNGVGGHLDGDVQRRLFRLERPAQDVVGALAAARRLVDPDADTDEAVVVQVGLERLQAVVPRRPAPD